MLSASTGVLPAVGLYELSFDGNIDFCGSLTGWRCDVPAMFQR